MIITTVIFFVICILLAIFLVILYISGTGLFDFLLYPIILMWFISGLALVLFVFFASFISSEISYSSMTGFFILIFLNVPIILVDSISSIYIYYYIDDYKIYIAYAIYCWMNLALCGWLV